MTLVLEKFPIREFTMKRFKNSFCYESTRLSAIEMNGFTAK